MLKSYIKLIRPVNLIMIVFTLCMVRYFFILPIYIFNDKHTGLGGVTYSIFALSYILIAAAGYIINDYYDIEIDKINRPEKLVIGKTVSKASALTIYWIFNACGLVAGFWSCNRVQDAPLLWLLFVFYVTGLWFYSYKLKKTFLLGNLLIAIFLGLVPFGSISVEWQEDFATNVFYTYYDSLISIRTGAWSLVGFAFLTNLIREIVKDMEDKEGDKKYGGKTMPIVLGLKMTKIVISILVIFMLGILVFYQYWCCQKGLYFSIIYIVGFVQLPCFIVLWKIFKSSAPKHFHTISALLKIIMVTGICYLFVFTYEACRNYSPIKIHN